jgi:sec-independent protein translocase protein TatB
MFNIGGGEVLVILLLALIVLGPDRLPSAARTIGRHLGDFRRITGGFRDEIANAMSLEPSAPTSVTEPAPVAASAPTHAAAPEPASGGEPVIRAEGPVESFV